MSESSPVVLLDDPRSSRDEEHRTTFARYVVEQLLQQNIQVIIATNDEKLSRLLSLTPFITEFGKGPG